MNIGVILAGGVGNRFGSSTPKQYNLINGKQVISYVVDAFRKSKQTDAVIIVAAKPYLQDLADRYHVPTVEGGVERNETVYNALQYIRTNYPACTKVIFADSARPMLTPVYIDRVYSLLDEHAAVITTAKITDSLAYLDTGLVPREDYRLIQTPEAFRFATLDGFDPGDASTAIMQQCNSNDIYYCDELSYNFKITYPRDLKIAQVLLEEEQ